MNNIFATKAAALGVNIPDYAAEEYARLLREFGGYETDVAAINDEARKLPAEFDDKETADSYTAIINRMSDLDKRIEGSRISEGTPYLRKKDACDSFFFGLRERLFKRKPKDKNGSADILHARLHAYNLRRLEAERRAREEAERRAAKAEAEARAMREAAERTQREAEEKAARARKAENIKAAEEAARVAKEAADKAAAEEETKRAERQQAEEANRAKPADMVRERHSEGMNTMAMVWFVGIDDEMKLDPVKLWPFIKTDAKESALKNWAKTTNYRQPMPGAIIEERPDTRVRR
jgi:chemotaxis protein histidine kinase CheA